MGDEGGRVQIIELVLEGGHLIFDRLELGGCVSGRRRLLLTATFTTAVAREATVAASGVFVAGLAS